MAEEKLLLVAFLLVKKKLLLWQQPWRRVQLTPLEGSFGGREEFLSNLFSVLRIVFTTFSLQNNFSKLFKMVSYQDKSLSYASKFSNLQIRVTVVLHLQDGVSGLA